VGEGTRNNEKGPSQYNFESRRSCVYKLRKILEEYRKPEPKDK